MLRTGQTTLSPQSGSAGKSAGQGGFTIIEVCIAMLIMLIASIGVIGAFAFSIQNNSSAGDRAIALALAQQRIEQLRNADFNDATLAQTVNPVVQNLTSANRPFAVTTTITDVDTDASAAANGLAATAKIIRVDVTPGGSSWRWANGTVTVVTVRSSFSPGPNFCGTC